MSRKDLNKEKAKKDLAALVLSAGYSSRMKAFKPLLPFGNTTVLEHVVETFLEANITNVIVVTGYESEKIRPILDKKNIQWVYNEDFDDGMYSSIVAGLKALPSHIKGIFLLPVDIPLVQSETIEKLTQAYVESKKDIIYPSFNYRKGHPPLISSKLFAGILDYDGTGGLKIFLKQYDNQVEYVEVEDEGVLLDMDTPDQYIQLRAKIDKG